MDELVERIALRLCRDVPDRWQGDPDVIAQSRIEARKILAARRADPARAQLLAEGK
jgi:hypothetical protein